MVHYFVRLGTDQKYYLDVDKDTYVIGRHEACDINFTSLFISRQHCQVQRLLPNGKLTIKNLKQTNTTYVDDIVLQDTSKCVELHIGSRIGLGVPLTYANEEGFNNKDYVFLSLWSTDTVGDTKIVDLDETLELSPRAHDASLASRSHSAVRSYLPPNYSSGNSCSAQQLGATLGHSSAINHTTPCPQSNNSNILQHHQNPHYISPPILREDNHPQSHTSTVAHHSLEYASTKSHISKSPPLTDPPYSAIPCSTSSPHCSRAYTQANPYNSKHLAIESQHMGGPYSQSPYTKPHTSANTHSLIESSDSPKLNHTGSLYDAVHSSYLNKLGSRDPSHQWSQQTSGNISSQSAYHRGISSQPAQPILAQHSSPGDESNIIQILVQEKPKSLSTECVDSGQPFSYVSSRQVFDVQLPSEKQQISQRDHNENTRPSARVAPLQSNSKQLYPNSDVSHHTDNSVMESNNCSHVQNPQLLPELKHISSSHNLQSQRSDNRSSLLMKENSSPSNHYLGDKLENRCHSQAPYASMNQCLSSRSVGPQLDAESKNESTTNKHQDTKSKNSECRGVVANVTPIVKKIMDCRPSNDFVNCDTSNTDSDNTDCDEIIDLTQNDPDSPRGYECDNQLEKRNFTDLTEIQCNLKDETKRKRDENNKADIELLRTEKEERLSTINSSDELPYIKCKEENENASNLWNTKKKRIERVSPDAECNYTCEGTNQDKGTSSGRGSKVDTVFRKDSMTECFEKCQNKCCVNIVRLPSHIVENLAPASHSELDKPGTSYKLNDKSDDTVDKSKTISNESCTGGFKSSERPVMKGNHKRKRSQNGKDSGKGTKYEKKLKCSDRNGSMNELDRGQTSHITREESESKGGNRVIAEQDVCVKLEDGAIKNREQMPGYEITNMEKEKKNCVNLENVTVKIEHSECGPMKVMSSGCSEEDDDDIDIMNYSQVNEAIWISSDEDEETNDSNSSICPLLSSPHLEELFREVKTENMNEDSFDVKESLPVVKTEPVEDQWFPILSQSCWDDDDVLILEDDEASTSSSPLPASEAGPHISSPNSEDDKDGNNQEWWPQLSQGFSDEEEEEGGSKESGDSNIDFLVPSTSTLRNLKQKNKAHSVFEKTSHKESNLQKRDSKSRKLSRKSAPKKVTVADNTEGHGASSMDDLDGSDEPIPDLHKKLPGVSTSSLPGPSHLHNSRPTSNNDDEVVDLDDWWPELSQAFLDSIGEEKNGNECKDRCKDGDQVNKDLQKASKSSDNLNTIVSKLKHTQQRKSLLTSPKAPPPRKRGKKFYGKSVEERAVSQKSSSEKTKNDRQGKTARPTEGSKQKKKDKKQQSLRDNLSSKFNLEPYKATLEHKAKENHHVVPKTKTNSSNKLQIHPPSSDSTSLNISIQNRSKLKDSEVQEKSRPKVAAKVTKKSRSEKLTEVDIFKNVPSSRFVSKRSNFKIPKTTVNTRESSDGPSSSGVEGGSSIIPVLTKRVKESSNVTINSHSWKLQTVPSIGKERQEDCKVLPKPVTDKNQRSVDGNVTTRGILKSLPENTNRPGKNVRFPTDEKDLLSIRVISPRKKKECLGIPEYLVEAMSMNDVQQKAVVEVSNKCLFDSQIPKLSLIHGPPGTGKTRTITALIAQIIALGQKLQSEGRGQGCRVLLCAPSNAAVDELTLRLAKLREVNICLRIVRAGVKESIRNEVQSYTLDTFVEKQVRRELATPKNKSMRQEWERRKCMAVKAAEELQNAIKENKNQAEIRQMEMRLCELVRSKDDLERSFQTQLSVHDRQILQRKWQDKILLGAEVVTTTLGSCISGVMGDVFTRHPNHFTCCIVDEAGQCQETETWLPLLLGVRKLVLVGDHRQLPATVLSRLAKDKNLKQSLFERLYHRIVVELQEEIYVHALTTQYRMHPEIVKWPSQHFYQGRLATSPTIVQARTHALKPYIFFDLKSSQEQRLQGKELYNPTEASLIYNICEALQVQGCKEKIAVITPYLRQKFSLDGRLSKFHRCLDLVISTIDAFQGQERDIVILSFVRGNSFSKIGFLAQRQRLNVALTRARKSCFLVASLSSLYDNTDYKSLVEDAKKRRVVCTITEKEENDKSYLKFLYK
ncbi:hypothetical protein Pcinc_036461 [Petrolisthes cinctipes]|uniref:FHA domain-containing protein n=1 Tax=Petrolisthes cinctipes TaxID=88211 RepID=A0AAE1BW44_PETCI|nr:hypothetical protein Pcinc_036461 [Petrolisthes cinctipes]